jgi:hypothetical protein
LLNRNLADQELGRLPRTAHSSVTVVVALVSISVALAFTGGGVGVLGPGADGGYDCEQLRLRRAMRRFMVMCAFCFRR